MGVKFPHMQDKLHCMHDNRRTGCQAIVLLFFSSEASNGCEGMHDNNRTGDLEGRVVCQPQHCQQVCVGLQPVVLHLGAQHMHKGSLVSS